MTLDGIIEKYGTHELDIDCCKKEGAVTAVYAYCHQHNADGQLLFNHYLKIVGKFNVLKTGFDGATDINIHIAFIEKTQDGAYEIAGVGGYVRFTVEGELLAEELSEEEYEAQTAHKA